MITKNMTLLEILQKYPYTQRVFQEFRMSCPACLGASLETLEAGAKVHHVDLEKLLEALNHTINRAEQES